MKLYKMTCSQEDGNEQFTAYFITRENDAIEGIVRENDHTSFCIKGVLHDSGEIAFLKVSCLDSDATPCVFVFEDTGKGYYSNYELFYGFNKWAKGWNVTLEEVDDNHLLGNVAMRFKHKYITLRGIGKSLIDNYKTVEEFF